jgi:hypothetical protein
MKSATAISPSRQENNTSSPERKPVISVSRNDEVSVSPPKRVSASPVSGPGLSENQAISREEQIRLRAYELYVESGYSDGYAEDHWFAAEREISGENK